MSKKIIVVGGVAGGASVAARARRLDESAKIIMYEKGPNVSFSNCALPYHLSGMIPNADDIVLMDPVQFKRQYNIDAIVNHEVISIDAVNRAVTIKNMQTGETMMICFYPQVQCQFYQNQLRVLMDPMFSRFVMLTT